jgi:hypothetical protein
MTDEHTPQNDSSFHVPANTVGANGPGAHGKANQHFYPSPAPPPASRPTKDWLPLQPNPLFQERPGEFEALEKLLFGQNGSGRVGLVGVVGKTYLYGVGCSAPLQADAHLRGLWHLVIP